MRHYVIIHPALSVTISRIHSIVSFIVVWLPYQSANTSGRL